MPRIGRSVVCDGSGVNRLLLLGLPGLLLARTALRLGRRLPVRATVNGFLQSARGGVFDGSGVAGGSVAVRFGHARAEFPRGGLVPEPASLPLRRGCEVPRVAPAVS